MLKISFLTVLSCLLLTGCEHFKPNPFYDNGDSDYEDSYEAPVTNYSNGNVQVFDLSGPAAGQGNSSGYSNAPAYQDMQPAGMPSSTDPNVTVYPIDAGVPQRRPSAPGMLPPSQYKAPYASPFDSSAIDPADAKVLYFAHGSDVINARGQAVVSGASREFQSQGGSLVNVVGHASKRTATTDPVERQIVNMKMSMKRALAVSEELEGKGVPSDLIRTTAMGDSIPAKIRNGKSQEAADRRVEIYMHGGLIDTSSMGGQYHYDEPEVIIGSNNDVMSPMPIPMY